MHAHLTNVLRARSPFRMAIFRDSAFQAMRLRIDTEFGGMDTFSKSYERFGFSMSGRVPNEIVFREWCPGAAELSLVGDFNDWDPTTHPAARLKDSEWQITLPPKADGSAAIVSGSRVRISIAPQNGGPRFLRIPAWIERAEQPKDEVEFVGVYVAPEEQEYTWKHQRPPTPKALKMFATPVFTRTAFPVCLPSCPRPCQLALHATAEPAVGGAQRLTARVVRCWQIRGTHWHCIRRAQGGIVQKLYPKRAAAHCKAKL